MSQLLQNVSFQQLKSDLGQNGYPGAEDMTSDFVVFTGSVGLPAGGSQITNPPTVKLNNEYGYYLTEIRGSGNFLPGAAAIGAQPYIPTQEAQHLALQIQADGRTRPVFRQVVPMAQLVGQNGQSTPFILPVPVAFTGAETLICTASFLGTWNPAAVAATLDWTITLVCGIIKTDAVKFIGRR